MKWILPVISGFASAYLGYGLDSVIFWAQAAFVAVLVAALP